MKYNILLSVLGTTSSLAGRCELDWSCSAVNSNYVLANIPDIPSVELCRQQCLHNQQCNFFTFYNSSSAPGVTPPYNSSKEMILDVK